MHAALCEPVAADRFHTLHLAAAMPSISQFQEWSIEETPWTDHLYEPVPRVHDGVVALGAEPGWGVHIDPSVCTRAEHQISR